MWFKFCHPSDGITQALHIVHGRSSQHGAWLGFVALKSSLVVAWRNIADLPACNLHTAVEKHT